MRPCENASFIRRSSGIYSLHPTSSAPPKPPLPLTATGLTANAVKEARSSRLFHILVRATSTSHIHILSLDCATVGDRHVVSNQLSGSRLRVNVHITFCIIYTYTKRVKTYNGVDCTPFGDDILPPKVLNDHSGTTKGSSSID